jgi:hypothetical protein
MTSTFDDFLPDAAEGTGGGDLEILRITEEPTVVTLFTDRVGKAATHYLALPELRAEVQCNRPHEARCLLCDLRKKRTTRAVLPVFDVQSDQIRALLVSDARYPHALAPLLKGELRKGGLDRRYLAISRKGVKFTVESLPAGDGHDLGETAISQFMEKLEAGAVALDRVLPVYPNAELWNLPELARQAAALGLERSRYEPTAAGGEGDQP